MARIKARQRRNGQAKGVRIRTSGQNCQVSIANAKVARIKAASVKAPRRLPR